ncbi:hypothetical protein NEP50_27575 [Escherichia coli]|nr:hypothetical protein [Escherichia coli]
MAADNTSRAAVLRTMLFFGMVIYFGYSLAFQNTEELKYQITQEVNASRSIISNDRWKSVIANSEATLNWLVHDYKGRCEQVPDMRSSYSSGAHPRGTS